MRNRILIPLTLTLTAYAMLLSGCKESYPREDPLPEEPPMEITMAYWNVEDNLTGDAVQKFIEDKFNVRFVPVAMNYGNYQTILQQLSVQNDLPDIFASDIMGTSTYETWIRSNKIRSIPKDISAYPMLEEYLFQPYIERFKRPDGFFYSLPRITYESEYMWSLDRCILVRKDWMENLGLALPQNWEEFEAMLWAFVYNDPDGNGKDDTIGLTTVHANLLEAVYLSVFPELSNTERGWIYEDGQWMPVYNSKRTANALQKMQDLYRKGLLSDRFMYSTGPAEKADFINGKSGAICAQYFEMLKNFTAKNVLDKADDMIMVLPPWPAEDGNRYRFTTSLHWSEMYFGSNIDDEKMQKILKILNWILSDEFHNILQYGLEGVDWEYQGETPVFLNNNAVSPRVKYPSLNLFCCLVEWNQDEQYEDTVANELLYGKENILYAQEQIKWFQENTQRVRYNYDIIFMSTPAKDKLIGNQYVQQKMFQVIIGQEDALTAWPKVLDNLKETTALQQAIGEVTAEAARLGIEP